MAARARRKVTQSTEATGSHGATEERGPNPPLTQVERHERPAIADVERRPDECGRGPRQVRQHRRTREHFQSLRRDGGETEHAVLVEHNELVVGVEQLRPRKAAILPGNLAALQSIAEMNAGPKSPLDA